MELIPEWAPNIHPMLVHFPIAILTIAMLFDFISFFLSSKNRWWTQKATAFLYGIGAVTAIIVYYTGTLAADSVLPPADAQTVLTNHADWAWRTIWFYGIYAVARIAATWLTKDKHRLKSHIGFFVLSFAGLFLLIQTGNRGAKMVFKYGVGVQESQAEMSMPVDQSNEIRPETIPTAFNVSENGDWVWQIEQGAVQALKKNFQFLTGSIPGLNAKSVQTVEGSYALQFSGNDMNAFFVTNESYQSVQVDYYLDLPAFNGKVFLPYNVQDKNSFYFVSISSDGTIKQGRMVNGKPQIFKQSTIKVSKPIFVRVVSSGGHFRGYVDKKLVVHGHGDAPTPGSVGLKVNGNGTLLLKKMTLTQIDEH